MEYRRIYGLRAPRPVGDSTFMVPQMENYSLFANPFLDLNKRIGKLIEGMQQDAETKTEKDVKSKGKKQEMQKKGKESKAGDDKKLPKETSEVEVNFGIVLNVVTVKPEELVIKFGSANEIEVAVAQRNVHLKERITFSRRCTYKYELPDGIDKDSLVALRTSDDYLIILPRDLLREDLLKKSIEDAEESEESSDKDVEGAAKSEDKVPEEKPSKTQRGSKKSEKAAEGLKKTEKVLPDENCLMLVQVDRMLRPGMDIFMVRKYMADLESYVATVRKFVENASFVTQNSKTAERCLRAMAKDRTDKYYEERNIKGQKLKRKFTKEPSPESGYTSSEKQHQLERQKQPSEAYDESSGSSSTKSGQMQETSN